MESLRKLDELIEYVDEIVKKHEEQPPRKMIRRHRRTMTIKAWDEEQSVVTMDDVIKPEPVMDDTVNVSNTTLNHEMSLEETLSPDVSDTNQEAAENQSIDVNINNDLNWKSTEEVTENGMYEPNINTDDILNRESIGNHSTENDIDKNDTSISNFDVDRKQTGNYSTENDADVDRRQIENYSTENDVDVNRKQTGNYSTENDADEPETNISDENNPVFNSCENSNLRDTSDYQEKHELNGNTIPVDARNNRSDDVESNHEDINRKLPVFEYKLVDMSNSVKIVEKSICINPDKPARIFKKRPLDNHKRFMKSKNSIRSNRDEISAKSDIKLFDTDLFHSIRESLVDCRSSHTNSDFNEQNIPVSFVSEEKTRGCKERQLIEDILRVVSHGDLETDLRLVDLLERIIEKLEKSKDSFTCKVAVNIAICKKYVQDFIELKRIIGDFANIKL